MIWTYFGRKSPMIVACSRGVSGYYNRHATPVVSDEATLDALAPFSSGQFGPHTVFDVPTELFDTLFIRQEAP